jgi:hypothetical protein
MHGSGPTRLVFAHWREMIMADTPDAAAAGGKQIEKQAKEIEKLVKENDKLAKEKDLKIEKIEVKDHKDIKIEKIEKNENKEHKDTKNEKLEKNELKEHKDAKHEKLEKLEHKEIKNEAKDFKVEVLEKQHKIEAPEKTIGKEKDGKELVDGPIGNPGDPIEQRLSNLEQNVAGLQHFITTGQRPDLSRGALSGEPDAAPAGRKPRGG